MIALAAVPPWLWKAGIGAAIVVGLYAGHRYQVSVAYDKGHAAAITARAAADLGAVVNRVQENAVAASLQTKINLDITKAKNEELAPVVQRIYVDRVRVGPAICNRPAAPAATEGASSSDGANSAARLVPQQVEDDIRALTAEVEKHLATGRACQRFNTDNGLVP